MLRLQGLPPPALDGGPRHRCPRRRRRRSGACRCWLGAEPARCGATPPRRCIAWGSSTRTASGPPLHPAPAGYLRFAHPLLRSVVYESIPAFVRTALHTQAARQLQRERAPAAAVAQQLMFTEPAAGAPASWRSCARRRPRRSAAGSPSMRRPGLARALGRAPAATELAGVLHELGRAEAAAALPGAVEHLERAYDEARSPTAAGADRRGPGAVPDRSRPPGGFRPPGQSRTQRTARRGREAGG